jgi:hypothetical protein
MSVLEVGLLKDWSGLGAAEQADKKIERANKEERIERVM